MEIKKTAAANIETERLTYIFLGLVFALSVLYVAFEWTQAEVTIHDIQEEILIFDEELNIEQTVQEETTPPPPPEEIPDVIEEITVVEDDVKTEEINFVSDTKTEEVIQIVQAPVAVEPEPEVEEVFLVVEKQPEFPGGTTALMKYFSDNVRYPVVAAENGIQGRVVCQFTIWKDGSVSDIQVLRSVDKSLDNEAIRLIKNMPKWKPGEQRGKKVACKFTVPVVFKLQ